MGRALDLDYNLSVATSANQVSKEDKHIQRLLNMGVHGIIIGVTTARFHASKKILEMTKNFIRNLSSVFESGVNGTNTNPERDRFKRISPRQTTGSHV